MAIEDTSLWNEVHSVLLDTAKPVHFFWTCDFLANGVLIPAVKVLSKDNERLYDVNFADALQLEVAIGLGTYSRRIFPYRENLRVVLTRMPIGESGNLTVLDEPTVVQSYRAIPMNTNNQILEGNHPIVQKEESADISNIIQVKLQLMDDGIEQIRLARTGGVFHQQIPGKLIETLLTDLRSQLPVDQENTVYGVQLTEPDNTTPRETITLKHGTRLVDVPFMLQKDHGGVYNAGIGCYFQNNIWYVSSLFNTTRFDDTPNTVTIINVPPQKLPGIERTYRTTGRQTIILATGDTSHHDTSEHQQLNDGNGVRFNSGDRFYEGFSSTAGNKTTIARARNANEFQTTQRATGINNLELASSTFTSNNYFEVSKLAERDGAYVQLMWEHSESGLLKPFQPVRLLYLQNDQVVETFGVLLRVHEYTHQVEPGLTNRRHRSNSALTLFIKRELNFQES